MPLLRYEHRCRIRSQLRCLRCCLYHLQGDQTPQPPRGAAALPFEYQPVIFESSGGFGESAISWWKNVRALDERINAPVSGGVSPVLPPDQYTWSAQRFSSYWLQRISLAMALAYSTHSDLVLTQCDGFGADPG